MNRRSFFGFLAVAPVAAVLPSVAMAAPRHRGGLTLLNHRISIGMGETVLTTVRMGGTVLTNIAPRSFPAIRGLSMQALRSGGHR